MRRAFLVCGLLALGASSAIVVSAGSAPSFAPAKSYATGRHPASVAIGDLNGDGKADLVTSNAGANIVSVLFSRGDGTFQAKRDYPTGRRPSAVAIGDLNGDGKPDLATANANADTVSVLLGRGDGGFEAELEYRTGSEPSSVAIGDLNGDGKPDLAITNSRYRVDTLSVLVNRGDGTFQLRVDYPTGLRPASIAIGDLNGDGKADLATANSGTYTVSVLLNRGDGTFDADHEYPAGSTPWSIALGDLNGDGTSDLATANYSPDCSGPDPTYGPSLCPGSNTVSVFANKGNGTFRAHRDYRTGLHPVSIAIGNLTGDGNPDLATANSYFEEVERYTVSVLAGRGGGTFNARIDYPTGRHPVSIALGDLDGDGKPDVATANFDASTTSVLLNRPGLCTVQEVEGLTLPAAKAIIARADCRVGRIRRAYSSARRGRVRSQKPNFGAVLPGGGKVNLVVSRGRRP